ncbi:MAG: hypothetical protein H7A46_23400 [Verrucomicrobiales bacterium]|nr:hypothetical protein [Verrucomicrobiales bacterium]
MNCRFGITSMLLVTSLHGAPDLQNGSFEEAARSYMREMWQMGPTGRLLPSWESSTGGTMYYDGGQVFYGNVMVYDNTARERDELLGTSGVAALPLAGDVAVGVIPNAYTSFGVLAPPPYLEQSSLIPVETRSLWFLWQGERLDLRINGNLVPFSLAEQRLTEDPFVPIHNYYAADIREYAGQEATIRFEFYAYEVHAEVPWPGAVQALDDIYFSPIPEPSPVTLLILGSALLVAGHRTRSRRGVGS